MACAKPKGIKDSSFEIYSDQLSVLLGYLLGEEGDQKAEMRMKYMAAPIADNSTWDSNSNSESISIQ